MPKLRRGFLPIILHAGRLPPVGIIEQFMVNALIVGAPYAERDRLSDVPCDRHDIVSDRYERDVEPNGHVPAGDVEAHPGNADLLLVGDHAADRLRIAEVAVGTENAADHVSHCHAVAHLRHGRLVVLSKHRERAVPEFWRLCSHCRDTFGCGRRLACKVLFPRRLPIGAPCRH